MLDIKERLTEEYLAKFEEFTLKHFIAVHNAEMFCCPTANCRYVFNWVGDENRFRCPLCESIYCLACKEEWHEGDTCEENRANKDPEELDRKFNDLVNGQKYKQCPG